MFNALSSLFLSITLALAPAAPKPPICQMQVVDQHPGFIDVLINCDHPGGFAIVLMDKYIANRADSILYIRDTPQMGQVRTLFVSDHDLQFHTLAIKELP